MRSTENKNAKEFTLKQKVSLYFYRSKQYLDYKRHCAWIKVKRFVNSFYFYMIVLGGSVFLLHKALFWLDITISNGNLYNLAFAVAGIIGASIAIIFSFSTFILQSTADLFSTQYLKKFIEDPKESIFFWLLVLLTLASLFAPVFLKKYVPETLVIFLFFAFYLIYILYRGSRKRIDPEVTLTKIRDDAIRRLEKINKGFKKHAYIQNKVFEYEKENNDLSLDVQYKINANWHSIVLQNVKYLYEIGLRLLAKNEINSFNLTVKYIHDIYLKHLSLRNKYFIRMPVSFWGTYFFDDEGFTDKIDEGFTDKILEYLQSIGNRIIQEKRKENFYYLLNIYRNILINSLSIEYADITLGSHKGNPLANLILAYYIGFIEKLLASKENDWIWESIKSVSNVSYFVLQKTDDYFIISQLNKVINKIFISCLSNNKEIFLEELANIYFNQIETAWNKYENNEIFWKDLFKELKKNVLRLLIASNLPSLSVFKFHEWQGKIINWIIEIKTEKEKKENLDKFVQLLERWSDFLLDFARDTGLENNQIGFHIIQSIENNVNIIYRIKRNFDDLDLDKIYKTQFYTLSWYFKKTEKVEGSCLPNFELSLEILLREISHNLKNKEFDIEYLIELYIRLIDQHFEKVTLGYGYNHPKVIVKLVYLGLLLNKHKRIEQEKSIIVKIDELNKKYLELKKKDKNLMRLDEYQLCKELHDLENDLFSYNSGLLTDVKSILKDEITKEDWDDFKKKINHCRDIKYETINIF